MNAPLVGEVSQASFGRIQTANYKALPPETPPHLWKRSEQNSELSHVFALAARPKHLLFDAVSLFLASISQPTTTTVNGFFLVPPGWSTISQHKLLLYQNKSTGTIPNMFILSKLPTFPLQHTLQGWIPERSNRLRLKGFLSSQELLFFFFLEKKWQVQNFCDDEVTQLWVESPIDFVSLFLHSVVTRPLDHLCGSHRSVSFLASHPELKWTILSHSCRLFLNTDVF